MLLSWFIWFLRSIKSLNMEKEILNSNVYKSCTLPPISNRKCNPFYFVREYTIFFLSNLYLHIHSTRENKFWIFFSLFPLYFLRVFNIEELNKRGLTIGRKNRQLLCLVESRECTNHAQ